MPDPRESRVFQRLCEQQQALKDQQIQDRVAEPLTQQVAETPPGMRGFRYPWSDRIERAIDCE